MLFSEVAFGRVEDGRRNGETLKRDTGRSFVSSARTRFAYASSRVVVPEYFRTPKRTTAGRPMAEFLADRNVRSRTVQSSSRSRAFQFQRNPFEVSDGRYAGIYRIPLNRCPSAYFRADCRSISLTFRRVSCPRTKLPRRTRVIYVYAPSQSSWER